MGVGADALVYLDSRSLQGPYSLNLSCAQVAGGSAASVQAWITIDL